MECVQDPKYCDRVGGCTVHLVWGEMGDMLVNFLTDLSLAELMRRQIDKNKICPPDGAVVAAS